jgi:hypothetical protein
LQPWSHALALPLSGALLLAAVFLAKRRYRAWQGAIALLVLLGGLNLLKDLAFEEALLSWAAAGVLAWGRPAFAVAPAPEGLRSSARLALGVIAGSHHFHPRRRSRCPARSSRRAGETAALLPGGPVGPPHPLSLFLAIGLDRVGPLAALPYFVVVGTTDLAGLEARQRPTPCCAHGPDPC